MTYPSVLALPIARYAPVFPCYLWNGNTRPTGLPAMWLRLPTAQSIEDNREAFTHWLPIDSDPQVGLVSDTPNASLPPLDPTTPWRKMVITIEVAADFEKRLDNQWMVEREIAADRWIWEWADAEQRRKDEETKSRDVHWCD